METNALDKSNCRYHSTLFLSNNLIYLLCLELNFILDVKVQFYPFKCSYFLIQVYTKVQDPNPVILSVKYPDRVSFQNLLFINKFDIEKRRRLFWRSYAPKIIILCIKTKETKTCNLCEQLLTVSKSCGLMI